MFKSTNSYDDSKNMINTLFSRVELRTYAKKNNIPTGRNKKDTIRNILAAAKEKKIAIHITINLI